MAKHRSAARRDEDRSPASTVERYRVLLGDEETAELLTALEQPLHQAFRVNQLKIDPAQAERTWPEWYGWEVRPVPYCPAGWQVVSAERRLSQTPEYKLGFYFIQDAASMLPAELMDFSGVDAPLVLDLAAAPGGKTTHLVDRTCDRALVVANDSSASRISALRAVLQDWGAINTAVTNFAGEMFGVWYPEVFDRVLLDAPCSMENLRPDEGHGQRPISDRERSSLASRQTRLLASAFQALKPGGHLVYSTCTLAPEEDEAVVDGLLRLYPEQARVESVSDRLPQPAPALSHYEETQFDPQVENAVRLWPHRYGTSGFFAARIAKIDSIQDVSQAEPPRRSIENAGFTALDRSIQASLLDGFSEAYSFDLRTVIEEQRLSLWKRGDAVHALPEALLEHFPGLPVQAAGLTLGELSRDGFVPSHELVARFGLRFQRNILEVSLVDAERWFTGQDLPVPVDITAPSGTILVLKDERGRLLGRGKRLTDRLRNLLPRWLLR